MKKIITSRGVAYTHKGYYMFPQADNCYHIVSSDNKSIAFVRTLGSCTQFINELVKGEK